LEELVTLSIPGDGTRPSPPNVSVRQFRLSNSDGSWPKVVFRVRVET
jgi:hypothetical protein